MEAARKCMRFYEYHTVGYTTLWDSMSIDHPFVKEDVKFVYNEI